jgi:hypothetical protein
MARNGITKGLVAKIRSIFRDDLKPTRKVLIVNCARR